MDILHLEETPDTPNVMLNKEAGVFEFSGRSLPEDSVEFYKPINEWINEYAKDPNAATVFTFKMEYFNTASSKIILDLLENLKNIKGVKVMWYYFEGDEDIFDAGKEFAEQVNIPIEFKAMK